VRRRRGLDARHAAQNEGRDAIAAVFSAALALIMYFRLIGTIGPLGTSRQNYQRAGLGVALGILVLAESLSIPSLMGITAAILGVVLVNAPNARSHRHA
jgi:hypothetical protein